MAVFRVEKNRNYTVMSNVHLKDKGISLKAKGLLSVILSLPEEESEALRETLFSSAGADGDEMAELTPEQEDALRWIVFAALP